MSAIAVTPSSSAGRPPLSFCSEMLNVGKETAAKSVRANQGELLSSVNPLRGFGEPLVNALDSE